MLRLINPAESFLSSSSPYAYFGLGKADRVDKILVKWPDGTVDEVHEQFDGVAADRHLVLTRGSGHKVRKREGQP
jgi:hypothetical protein